MTASIVRRVGPSVGTPLPARPPYGPRPMRAIPRPTTPWATAGVLRPSVTDPFVLGVTVPDATNTGVPAGTALTVYSGDIVVTTPGTILSELDVYGFVRVQAANVTIRHCRIRGRDTGNGYVVGGLTLPGTPSYVPPGNVTYPSPSSAGDGAYARTFPGWYGLIDATHASATGMLVERCTLTADYPAWWNYVIGLHDSTIHRCQLTTGNDGIECYGNNTITGNYRHSPTFFDMDYNQRASTGPYRWWCHPDGVMVTGARGGNTRIEGNYFDGLQTGARLAEMDALGYSDHMLGACVTFAATNGAINGCVVKNNWFDGAAASFQCNASNTTLGWTGASNTVGEISGNRVTRNQHHYGGGSYYQLRWATDVGVTNYTGTNVWMDHPSVIAAGKTPGAALTVGFTGGIRIP